MPAYGVGIHDASLVEHRAFTAHAKPLGDDGLVAPRDGFAAMPRGRVRRAVRVQAVPQHGHPDPGTDAAIDLREARRATFHVLVQVHHERPGAVSPNAAGTAVHVGIFGEVVAVRLEVSAHVVALRLDALGIFGTYA